MLLTEGLGAFRFYKPLLLYGSMALLSYWYIITTLFNDVLHFFVLSLFFVWCPCMAINEYNDGLVLD